MCWGCSALETATEDPFEAGATADGGDYVGYGEANAVFDGFGSVAEGCGVGFGGAVGGERGGYCGGEERVRAVGY